MEHSKYKKIVEDTSSGVFLYKDKEFVYLNKAFANMIGYAINDLRGTGFDTIIHPDYRDEVEHHIAEVEKSKFREYVKPIEIKAMLKEDSSILPKFIASFVKKEKEAKTIWLKIYMSLINLNGHKYILGHVFNVRDKKNYKRKLEYTYKGVIELIAGTIEINEIYRTRHHNQIKELTSKIAEEMDLSEKQKKSLKYASMVHGIGKLTVPAEILSTSGKLSSVEFSYLKEHPKKGYELLKKINFPWPIAEIIYQHHERVDGSGYPNGLQGDEILLEARIFAVADVIIAMASHRPHREAYHIGEVLQEIINQKGKLFDSEVVNACVKVFREGFELFNKDK
ncbi:MAG: HD domain-containing protein [Candidatus Marinimicrobia bacterium]|nr:HD domain-containing protein [Candidatus Neomarinimicrobiota bacterium]